MLWEDKHYLSPLDLKAIEKGIAKLDVFHLRISREDFTEEEKTKIMCDNALKFVGREDLLG